MIESQHGLLLKPRAGTFDPDPVGRQTQVAGFIGRSVLFSEPPDLLTVEVVLALVQDQLRLGFAEHLDDVFHNHRVFVAPLLSGAGIKGKVLESMAYGLPAVLTSVAAEGTGLTHGVSACVAEKANEFAQSIIELYDDEQVWNKYRENMQTIVKNNFSKENGIKQMKDIFASVGIYCMP